MCSLLFPGLAYSSSFLELVTNGVRESVLKGLSGRLCDAGLCLLTLFWTCIFNINSKKEKGRTDKKINNNGQCDSLCRATVDNRVYLIKCFFFIFFLLLPQLCSDFWWLWVLFSAFQPWAFLFYLFFFSDFARCEASECEMSASHLRWRQVRLSLCGTFSRSWCERYSGGKKRLLCRIWEQRETSLLALERALDNIDPLFRGA